MKTRFERFQNKYEIDPATKCWLWRACAGRGGYGLFFDGSRTVVAHRYSYEYFRGEIPEGRQLDHLCRNPACVNPNHLEIVTAKENIARGTIAERAGKYQTERTHCPQGHPYSGENLYVAPDGGRECRICARAAGRRYALRVGKAGKRPKYEFRGESRPLAEWAKIVGISRRILSARILAGWDIDRTLTTPNRKGKC